MTAQPASIHPFRALAALVATAAVLHGVCAHASEASDTDADVPVHVHVLGHSLPLHTACPNVDEELPDELIQAWLDLGTPATVPVEFKLRGGRVYDVQSATESPRLARQLKRALRSMDCDGGDDEIHTVDLVVRFVYPHAGTDVADADTRVAIDAGE